MNEETVLYSPKSGEARLLVITGLTVQTYALSGEQSFGRPSASTAPDIPADSGIVSRRHGRFLTNALGSCYIDQGSLNGTTLNGRPLPAGETQLLSDGDVLKIHGKQDDSGKLDVILIYTHTDPAAKRWRNLRLSEVSEVRIGREEDLKLREQSVSRRHASVFRAEKGFALIDHGSTNGVFLNGLRLKEPVYLHNGDVIRIADYFMIYKEDMLLLQEDSVSLAEGEAPALSGVKEYEASSDPKPAAAGNPAKGLSIRIEERNVWHRAKKKTLLRDISLEIPTGSMTLILGGSGAGKTTFMNAVMGYERAEGSIRYAGTDIYREYERMKYEIGYVPQQDLLRMNDTVYDTLHNAAAMRLPVMSEQEYEKHVEQTLHLLGLERLRDSLVGKLSGGQRKRLSIAVEYIGQPALFFLDEPDSGLDGMMARRLMENLRQIADEGKIVLVISHSPDRAADLFDHMIVLAKNSAGEGRLVYFGSPEGGKKFFGVDSLEKIVGRINAPEEGGEGLADEFIRRYEAQSTGRRI